MSISKYLSRKIKFISLFSMIAVVFIHSYNYKDNFLTPTTSISEGFNVYAMFEYFISNALARFAVPLFFIISGFLFFRNYISIKESYTKKFKSRIFSLVIPYILWAFISALIMYGLSFISFTANTAIVKESVPFGAFSLLSCFIDPPAFQLWYVQQLIIFTVISPVFYFLIKNTKGIIILLFAVPWFLDLHFIINSQALFFFSVGAYIGIFAKERDFVRKEKRILTVTISLSWILLSLLITILAATENNSAPIIYLRLFLYRLNEVVGIAAVWVLYDHIFKRVMNKKIMILASNYLFFIYAFHEPILHLSYQLGLNDKSSDISHLILFIFMPICVISICIVTGMLVRKICKPLYNLLTGGRKTIMKYKKS